MPIKNFYYSFPTIYYFGENAIDNLQKQIVNNYQRVLAVTGASSAKKLGILEKIENICKANNVFIRNIHNVLPILLLIL